MSMAERRDRAAAVLLDVTNTRPPSAAGALSITPPSATVHRTTWLARSTAPTRFPRMPNTAWPPATVTAEVAGWGNARRHSARPDDGSSATSADPRRTVPSVARMEPLAGSAAGD